MSLSLDSHLIPAFARLSLAETSDNSNKKQVVLKEIVDEKWQLLPQFATLDRFPLDFDTEDVMQFLNRRFDGPIALCISDFVADIIKTIGKSDKIALVSDELYKILGAHFLANRYSLLTNGATLSLEHTKELEKRCTVPVDSLTLRYWLRADLSPEDRHQAIQGLRDTWNTNFAGAKFSKVYQSDTNSSHLSGFYIDVIHNNAPLRLQFVFPTALGQEFFATGDSLQLQISRDGIKLFDSGIGGQWLIDTLFKILRIPNATGTNLSKMIFRYLRHGYFPVEEIYEIFRREHCASPDTIALFWEKLCEHVETDDVRLQNLFLIANVLHALSIDSSPLFTKVVATCTSVSFWQESTRLIEQKVVSFEEWLLITQFLALLCQKAKVAGRINVAQAQIACTVASDGVALHVKYDKRRIETTFLARASALLQNQNVQKWLSYFVPEGQSWNSTSWIEFFLKRSPNVGLHLLRQTDTSSELKRKWIPHLIQTNQDVSFQLIGQVAKCADDEEISGWIKRSTQPRLIIDRLRPYIGIKAITMGLSHHKAQTVDYCLSTKDTERESFILHVQEHLTDAQMRDWLKQFKAAPEALKRFLEHGERRWVRLCVALNPQAALEAYFQITSAERKRSILEEVTLQSDLRSHRFLEAWAEHTEHVAPYAHAILKACFAHKQNWTKEFIACLNLVSPYMADHFSLFMQLLIMNDAAIHVPHVVEKATQLVANRTNQLSNAIKEEMKKHDRFKRFVEPARAIAASSVATSSGTDQPKQVRAVKKQVVARPTLPAKLTEVHAAEWKEALSYFELELDDRGIKQAIGLLVHALQGQIQPYLQQLFIHLFDRATPLLLKDARALLLEAKQLEKLFQDCLKNPALQDRFAKVLGIYLAEVQPEKATWRTYLPAIISWYSFLTENHPKKQELGWKILGMCDATEDYALVDTCCYITSVCAPYMNRLIQEYEAAKKRPKARQGAPTDLATVLAPLATFFSLARKQPKLDNVWFTVSERVEGLQKFAHVEVDSFLVQQLSDFPVMYVRERLMPSVSGLWKTRPEDVCTFLRSITEESTQEMLHHLFFEFFAANYPTPSRTLFAKSELVATFDLPEEKIQKVATILASVYPKFLEFAAASSDQKLVQDALEVELSIRLNLGPSIHSIMKEAFAQDPILYSKYVYKLFISLCKVKGPVLMATFMSNLYYSVVMKTTDTDVTDTVEYENYSMISSDLAISPSYKRVFDPERANGRLPIPTAYVSRFSDVLLAGENAYLQMIDMLMIEALRQIQQTSSVSEKVNLLDFVVENFSNMMELYPKEPRVVNLLRLFVLAVKAEDEQLFRHHADIAGALIKRAYHKKVITSGNKELASWLSCLGKPTDPKAFLELEDQTALLPVTEPLLDGKAKTVDEFLAAISALEKWQSGSFTFLHGIRYNLLSRLLDTLKTEPQLVINQKIHDSLLRLFVTHTKVFGVDHGEKGKEYALKCVDHYLSILFDIYEAACTNEHPVVGPLKLLNCIESLLLRFTRGEAFRADYSKFVHLVERYISYITTKRMFNPEKYATSIKVATQVLTAPVGEETLIKEKCRLLHKWINTVCTQYVGTVRTQALRDIADVLLTTNIVATWPEELTDGLLDMLNRFEESEARNRPHSLAKLKKQLSSLQFLKEPAVQARMPFYLKR